jgi:DNA-binding GntR family transcriptional regulator
MILKKLNLSNQIYEEIKNDIFKGKLNLGEKISINEVAEKYNVSHTPAREAIKSLIKDGLIIGSINKAHRIVNLTKKELSEVMEIRKMCECYSIDYIIRNFGEKERKNINLQISKLQSLEKNSEKTVKDFFYSTDIDFHLNLIKGTDNLKLLNIYQQISYIVNIIIYKIDNREEIIKDFFKEHIGILNVVLEKDNKKAKKLIEKHIDHSLKYYHNNILD